MKPIDIFYQGSHSGKVDHIQVDAADTVGVVKLRIIERHEAEADVLIFLEDHDDPIDEGRIVESIAQGNTAKVHIHRCHHVAVVVAFGGKSVTREFGPGTTVAHVKRWAAEKEFGMTKDDAGEHLLQIAGTHDRPGPGTHIGSLAKCPECRVAFDLVPDQRVNGYSREFARGLA
jgi:hypothetical protein